MISSDDFAVILSKPIKIAWELRRLLLFFFSFNSLLEEIISSLSFRSSKLGLILSIFIKFEVVIFCSANKNSEKVTKKKYY